LASRVHPPLAGPSGLRNLRVNHPGF
jgi:hypothetical protein